MVRLNRRNKLALASRARPAVIEPLEPRCHLSVIPPATVLVNIGYREAPDGGTARAHINWVDNNTTESGYRVEYSPDGVMNWNAVGADLPANATTTTQVLDAGQKYYYRVRALDGANVSTPSNVVSASMPVDRVIQVSATAQSNSVTLNWLANSNAVSYSIYRKARTDSTWTLLTLRPLPGRATNYIDSVPAGGAYEYQVQRFQHNYYWGADGYAIGYVYAGNQLAMVESPGRVLLVVDQTQLLPLANNLTTYRRDLIGDGWNVDQIVVPRDNGSALLAQSVKALIQLDAVAHDGGLQSIVLIGHVPVPYSGTIAWDGHSDHVGAWPADAYYGESIGFIAPNPWTDTKTIINTTYPANNNLPGDGKFDQDVLPNPVNVPVGRIDFANLGGMKFSFSPTAPDDQLETMLLQRYLQKDHLWRTGQISVPATAIEDDELGSAEAENGWRNFAPLVGAGNTTAQDWQALLNGQQNLWSFGLGASATTGITDVVLGTQLHNPTTAVGSVFNMLYGSYFGDWNQASDVMREVLAAPGVSLAAMWVGAPNWYLQTMGLGETIGQATMLTQNNSSSVGPYLPVSTAAQAPLIALMGDPTITMTVAKPITALVDNSAMHSNTLTWNAPAGAAVLGYYVYRASSLDGPFVRIDASPIPADGSTLHYTDNLLAPRNFVYMVRAIELQTTPSGSYVNLSNGATIMAQVLQNLTAQTGANSSAAPTSPLDDSGIDDTGDIIDQLGFGYSGSLTNS